MDSTKTRKSRTRAYTFFLKGSCIPWASIKQAWIIEFLEHLDFDQNTKTPHVIRDNQGALYSVTAHHISRYESRDYGKAQCVGYGSAMWQCARYGNAICIRCVCEEGYEDVVYKRPDYALLIALFLTQRLVSNSVYNVTY